MAGLFQMIQKNDMLKLLLVLVAVYFFMQMYNSKKDGLENTENTASSEPVEFSTAVKNGDALGTASNEPAVPEPLVVQGVAQEDRAEVVQPSAPQEQAEKVLAGGAQLTADDLLPKYDDANEFAKENPVSKLLQEQNFLQAGYHIGINTVVQSNKIPYLDIRSAPPIPKEQVGPWNNSSFERPAGFGRKFLEIGS